MVPIIETERLRLRAFRESDFEAHAATLRDEEVARYLGGVPAGREDSWRRTLASLGAWEVLGYGYWMVESLETGSYLGTVGFADMKRDMQPSIEGYPEMGWIFAPHAQGKGYASEAVAAGLRWADDALAEREITAIISHGNVPSIRVAEKNGFSRREEATYKGEPILLFRRP